MGNEIRLKQPIEIKNIFKQSLSLYKENFSLFIAIATIGYTLMILNVLRMAMFGATYESDNFVIVIIGLLGNLIGIWGYIALIIAVSSRYQNNSVTLKECFIKAKGKYWHFMVISILYSLIVGTGFLLLIIPGIYLGTIFSLAYVAVILEKRKDIGPLSISKELIKGYFGKVFLLGITLLLLALPFNIIIFAIFKTNQNLSMVFGYIFFILYIPFGTGVSVALYHKLKDIKETQLPPESEIPVKRGKGCLGCLGALGLVILIIALSTFWILSLRKFLKIEIDPKMGLQIGRQVSKDGVEECKVEGILYSEDIPCAMIGGEVRCINDAVCGVQIIKITADTVTIEHKGNLEDYSVGSIIKQRR